MSFIHCLAIGEQVGCRKLYSCSSSSVRSVWFLNWLNRFKLIPGGSSGSSTGKLLSGESVSWTVLLGGKWKHSISSSRRVRFAAWVSESGLYENNRVRFYSSTRFCGWGRHRKGLENVMIRVKKVALILSVGYFDEIFVDSSLRLSMNIFRNPFAPMRSIWLFENSLAEFYVWWISPNHAFNK